MREWYIWKKNNCARFNKSTVVQNRNNRKQGFTIATYTSTSNSILQNWFKITLRQITKTNLKTPLNATIHVQVLCRKVCLLCRIQIDQICYIQVQWAVQNLNKWSRINQECKRRFKEDRHNQFYIDLPFLKGYIQSSLPH